MRQSRIFIDLPLIPDRLIELPPEARRHLVQVLRLGEGASFCLFNGDGRDYRARLESLGRDLAQARILAAGESEPTPPLDISLALGISRGERMDYALQKAVELGVNRLSPLLTERTLVRLDAKRAERRLEHWQGVVIGACEQSGRRRVPRLDPPMAFTQWLQQAPAGALLLDPLGERALTDGPPPSDGALTLLIGPEGGLSPAERTQAMAQGCVGVRLGPRILRTETAPLAAIAAIQALWGDF
ncbi:MAG: 16S rRNA (uracil(1498)-N(3))-methyltransferase [Chromatiaceae bacterium]|nr:16S rRNA (uracil(1498)-N(3))-methyltransferase [Chromatiaceae bacterium]